MLIALDAPDGGVDADRYVLWAGTMATAGIARRPPAAPPAPPPHI